MKSLDPFRFLLIAVSPTRNGLYGTIKESCLERIILFGESGVRKATAEFMAHYHSERNHQGLDNALIRPEPEHAGGAGEVHRRERFGGLLNYYYRKAA